MFILHYIIIHLLLIKIFIDILTNHHNKLIALLKEKVNLYWIIIHWILTSFTADIASQYHISKYPTLKLVRNGQLIKKEYRGQRSVDALVQFVKDQVRDSVQQHNTLESMDELNVSSAVYWFQLKSIILKSLLC